MDSLFRLIFNRKSKILFRILYATDLHGSTEVFRKLIDVAVEAKVDAVVVGGDLTGKTLLLLEETQQGVLTDFYGDVQLVTKDNIGKFTEEIELNGCYFHYVATETMVAIQQNLELKRSVKSQLEQQRLREWMLFAERKLGTAGIRLIAICGNDDDYGLDKLFHPRGFCENPDLFPVTLFDDVAIIGESRVNMTPWNRPRDVDGDIPYNELNAKIMKGKSSKVVFLFHAPPYHTSLDLVLGKNLSVGGQELRHVGSRNVRRAIEDFQPLLSLHGHIHESESEQYINQSLCINPGSEEYNGRHNGTLKAVYIQFMQNGAIETFSITK